MLLESKFDRRKFIKTGASLSTGLLLGSNQFGQLKTETPNKLPRWRGFNLLDFFSPDPNKARPQSEERHFKWMADWGFDFVRIPIAYPSYLKFNREKPITVRRVRKMDKAAVKKVERLVDMAHKYGLHVSLNLHRAPGFCVNAGFQEPYNLWYSKQALEDFCYHWSYWAKKFKRVSRDLISFDLLNEPCLREDMNDQHSKRAAVPGGAYRKLVEEACKAIRKHNADHLIIADGNNIGSDVIPEITHLDVGQSCRGYTPGIISHYKAPWVFKESDDLPIPKWPGQVGDRYLSKSILEDMYAPWIALKNSGVGVHCGECGCWNQTPHDVFLAWFEDVLDILTQNGIGYSMWEFKGSFGILDSGREDVDYEDWEGHKLDRKLLDLLMKY